MSPRMWLYKLRIVGVGDMAVCCRNCTSVSHCQQMIISDVASSGSTNPQALPIPTTLSTHARLRRPERNLTTRPSFAALGFLRRNSARASSSEMAPEQNTYPRLTTCSCSICHAHPASIVSAVVYGRIGSSAPRSQPPTTARSQNSDLSNGRYGSASVLPSSSLRNPLASTKRSAVSVWPSSRCTAVTPPSPPRVAPLTLPSVISTPDDRA